MTSFLFQKLCRPTCVSLLARQRNIKSSQVWANHPRIKSYSTAHNIALSSRIRRQIIWLTSKRPLSAVAFHSSAGSWHNEIIPPDPGTGITVHFRDSNGNPIKTIEAREGDSILDLAHEYDVDLEGACEGSVACSTCHVILPAEYYDLLPEPSDDENDMLDMAFGLTDTSRLGCQVKLTQDLSGMTATLPSATRNMFVDGTKPTKH